MAIYLVKGKSFRAPFTAITTTQSVSLVNLDVNPIPIPECEKSLKFYSSVIRPSASSGAFQETRGFCKEGISIRMKVNRRGDTVIRQGPGGGPYFDMDVTKNPLIMTIQLGSTFLENQLKGYKKPVKIKVELSFKLFQEKFNSVSKELSLPMDMTEDGYTFEEKLELYWRKFYMGGSSYSDGLLESDGPSSTPNAATTNKKILDDKIRCDFALIAENGKYISCHSAFLACHSEVFQRMFETNCKETMEKACRMGQTEKAVVALLNFLYCSDLDDPSFSICLELLEVAHKYNIVSLEKIVKRRLLEKPNEWYDLEEVLLLFQYTLKVGGYEDLRAKAVKVTKSKSDELRGSRAYENLFNKDPETAKEIFLLCLNK